VPYSFLTVSEDWICPAIWVINPVQELAGVAQSEELNVCVTVHH
jgi:hypothetical protein